MSIFCSQFTTRCECYENLQYNCGWDSSINYNASAPSYLNGACSRNSVWDQFELEDSDMDSAGCNWTLTTNGITATNTNNCKQHKNACTCWANKDQGCGWKSKLTFQSAINMTILESDLLVYLGEELSSNENFQPQLSKNQGKMNLGECRFGGTTHDSELEDALGFFGAQHSYSPGYDDSFSASKSACEGNSTCASYTTPCECLTGKDDGCGWSSADFRNPSLFWSEAANKRWRDQGRCRHGSTTTGYDVAITLTRAGTSTTDIIPSEKDCFNTDDVIDCDAYSNAEPADSPCVNQNYTGSNWKDFHGNTCAWYEQDPNRCIDPEWTTFNASAFGVDHPELDYYVQASEACCVCGGGVGSKTPQCNCWENAVLGKNARCGWSSAQGKCSATSRFSELEVDRCLYKSQWTRDHLVEYDLHKQTDYSEARFHVTQDYRQYFIGDLDVNGSITDDVFDTCFAGGVSDAEMGSPYTKCECLAKVGEVAACGWVSYDDSKNITLLVGTIGDAHDMSDYQPPNDATLGDTIMNKVTTNGGFCSQQGGFAYDANLPQLREQDAWKCLTNMDSLQSILGAGVVQNRGYKFDVNGTVPYDAPVRGFCDPYDNITEVCECYEHSMTMSSVTGSDILAIEGRPFNDLFNQVFEFIQDIEGYSESDRLTSTPFLDRSCWIMWKPNGKPYTDASGNFLPNPNSLASTCLPERFCGWSSEYVNRTGDRKSVV